MLAFQGPRSVVAAQLAVADFGLSGAKVIEADVGLTIVWQWLDTEGVDVILDVPNSSISPKKVLFGSDWSMTTPERGLADFEGSASRTTSAR